MRRPAQSNARGGKGELREGGQGEGQTGRQAGKRTGRQTGTKTEKQVGSQGRGRGARQAGINTTFVPHPHLDWTLLLLRTRASKAKSKIVASLLALALARKLSKHDKRAWVHSEGLQGPCHLIQMALLQCNQACPQGCEIVGLVSEPVNCKQLHIRSSGVSHAGMDILP